DIGCGYPLGSLSRSPEGGRAVSAIRGAGRSQWKSPRSRLRGPFRTALGWSVAELELDADAARLAVEFAAEAEATEVDAVDDLVLVQQVLADQRDLALGAAAADRDVGEGE